MRWQLTHSFTQALPEGFSKATALAFPDCQLAYLDSALLASLGLHERIPADALARCFAAQQLPEDAQPIAQAYAGHQFGHFNPQLGDGRAMLIGELTTSQGQSLEIGFKGTGPTTFSRGGDGKAALGPMLREVLISQAFVALGIPTTRPLAVTTTGALVQRQYAQPGAVLTRLASSHIRVGTFQYYAAREQYDAVERLVAYCIARHYPACAQDSNPVLAFLQGVIARQAALIAQWMGVGFIHGVMNTDNMLICGETIDFGPCAFMEAYDPATVFSSIDHGGRYAYGNQPGIAQWNLARLAETLLPLISSDKAEAIALATQAVNDFEPAYTEQFRAIMQTKLGLQGKEKATADVLIEQWLALLNASKADFTLAHWYLQQQDRSALAALLSDQAGFADWWQAYTAVLPDIAPSVNPCVIPRNHLVEEALRSAEDGDMQPFHRLLAVITRPFNAPDEQRFLQPAAPAFTEAYMTFCGT